MDEAYEAGKLVRRTRALRPDRSITILWRLWCMAQLICSIDV
jgi:hypothetical protein